MPYRDGQPVIVVSGGKCIPAGLTVVDRSSRQIHHAVRSARSQHPAALSLPERFGSPARLRKAGQRRLVTPSRSKGPSLAGSFTLVFDRRELLAGHSRRSAGPGVAEHGAG
ncbi:hypothetical protein ACFV6G_25600 [Streptomyces lavendulae]|uniref:hypothetical protein n=1 Tax=Streptomyces lavendulae TaxID=1914 RepID=UPI003692D35E